MENSIMLPKRIEVRPCGTLKDRKVFYPDSENNCKFVRRRSIVTESIFIGGINGEYMTSLEIEGKEKCHEMLNYAIYRIITVKDKVRVIIGACMTSDEVIEFYF